MTQCAENKLHGFDWKAGVQMLRKKKKKKFALCPSVNHKERGSQGLIIPINVGKGKKK